MRTLTVGVPSTSLRLRIHIPSEVESLDHRQRTRPSLYPMIPRIPLSMAVVIRNAEYWCPEYGENMDQVIKMELNKTYQTQLNN